MKKTPAQAARAAKLSPAYLRVSYLALWRKCKRDRNGRAELRHQRLPGIRIERADLDALGRVDGRST